MREARGVTWILPALLLVTSCAATGDTASSTAWFDAGGEPRVTTTDDSPAGPARADELAAARTRWAQDGPATYSYAVARSDQDVQDAGSCGHGLLWVVVEDGVVTDARDVERHCDVLDTVAPVADDLFALVERRLGSAHAGTTYDDATGLPLAFSAGDGGAGERVDLEVVALHPGAALPVAADLDAVLTEARARWAARGPASYTATLDVAAMVGAGSLHVTVADGTPVRATTLDGELPPGLAPGTVEEVLDRIADAGGESEVVLDPATGVPLHAWLDPLPDAVDDESQLAVHDLRPMAPARAALAAAAAAAPPLDPEVEARLAEAEAQWRASGPATYGGRMTVTGVDGLPDGLRAGTYPLRVDDGVVVRPDGTPVEPDRRSVVTAEMLFDVARLAGATEVRVDEATGAVRGLRRGDDYLGGMHEFHPGDARLASQRRALEAARARWREGGPVDYALEVEVACFCEPLRYTVTVRDGEAVDVVLDGDGHQTAEEVQRWAPLTVEQLHDIAATGIWGHRATVEFDPVHGHPTLVDLDPEELADDEESTYRAVLTPTR